MEFTRWVDSFDGRLAGLIAKDHVTALEPVDVDPWVEHQRHTETNNYLLAKSFIENKKYDDQWFSVIAKRLGAEATDDRMISFLLKIARNHHIASRQLKCDTSIENWDSPYYLAEIGRDQKEETPDTVTPSKKTSKLTIEDILYDISRCDIATSEDFKRHVDAILALKDSGVCQFLQEHRCHEVDIESDMIRKLKRKISNSARTNEKTIGGSTIVIDSFAYLGSLFLGAKIAQETLLTRREFLVGGAASAIATVEIASKGATTLEHLRWDPPVRLSNLERASLILLKGKSFDQTVPASLAKDIVAAIERFSHKA